MFADVQKNNHNLVGHYLKPYLITDYGFSKVAKFDHLMLTLLLIPQQSFPTPQH